MELSKYSKAAILGMGLSGKAVAEHLKRKNFPYICVDKKSEEIAGSEAYVQESSLIHLDGIDLIIKSPGITRNHRLVQLALEKKITVVGEIDLALSEIKNKRIIGVTGSNGKTSTVLFMQHLATIAGKKALALGNVGLPLISKVDSDAEILIVELSSFQLENILPVEALDAAVILNISPNHLDRYNSFTEYVCAKLQIQSCLKKGKNLYCSRAVEQNFAPKAEIFDIYKEKVESILPLRYRDGKLRFFLHDLENFCAAFAVFPDFEAFFLKALVTFEKPPHRIEFVEEFFGVSFINDSKATSVDAVIKAVSGFEKVLLLAGGVDKGGSYKSWIPFFQNRVVKVFAFGEAQDRIVRELTSEIPTAKVSSLEEGMQTAFHESEVGSTILLSPGCSSYDQFKSYEERGKRFKELVDMLKRGRS